MQAELAVSIRGDKTRSSRASQSVAVIICAYNSESRIVRTLSALAECVWPCQGEVLLVDNASTDSTAAVAVGFWGKHGQPDVPLRVIHEPTPGLSFARRRGCEEASADLLIFCDDDTHFDPDYLQQSLELMSDSDVGAAGGSGRLKTIDGDMPDWFYRAAPAYAVGPQVDILDLGTEAIEMPMDVPLLWGAGLVIRASLVRAMYSLPDFPVLADRQGTTLSSGGDSEITHCVRLLGKRLVYSGSLRYGHEIPARRMTPSYFAELQASCFRTAHIMSAYVELPRAVSERFLTLVRCAFRIASGRARTPRHREVLASMALVALGMPRLLKEPYATVYRNIRGLVAMKSTVSETPASGRSDGALHQQAVSR